VISDLQFTIYNLHTQNGSIIIDAMQILIFFHFLNLNLNVIFPQSGTYIIYTKHKARGPTARARGPQFLIFHILIEK
jgi:hypothetical protein